MMRTLVLICDQKPGHRSQLLGLAQALARLVAIEVVWLDIGTGLWPVLNQLSRQKKILACVGAGRKTAKYLVLAKLIRPRSITVYLMRPRLWPLWTFNYVVVPAHDGLTSSESVICTEGALNPIRPAVDLADDSRALILIGGPSSHYQFDADGLLRQIEQVIAAEPQISFTLTTSRRTPPDFISRLESISKPNLKIVPFEQTTAGWVAEHIALSSIAWVTEDSVSMIYESLSAGVKVAILAMPRKRPGRVVAGIDRLIDKHWVTPFQKFIENKKLYAGIPPLQESDRVAKILLNRWDHGT